MPRCRSALADSRWILVTVPYRLIVRLRYSSGLRLLEGLRLGVKDLDFARREPLVREGKSDKDRVTMLPESLEPDLLDQLEKVRRSHEKDLATGFGDVLPSSCARQDAPRG